jgi:predicted glycogen debranching enzyme
MGTTTLDKTVSMLRNENSTIINYRIKGYRGLLRIVPLIHDRSFHAAGDLPPIHQNAQDIGTTILSQTRFSIFSDLARYIPQERVYSNFEYEEERRRGLGWKENLFSPGCFELDVSGEAEFAIIASTWRSSLANWRADQESERERLISLKAPVPPLARAADSFLVKRGNALSLIAGYHWFDDWGRDAMIALPGLLLSTGRYEAARLVLSSFAGAMKDGVLPNDLGARSYNTVDASLWFVQATSRYYDATGDLDFLAELWPKLLDVVERYSRPGDDFGADEDGLINSGPALTWMDARVDGRPVTPRTGKCCEINALWYSALRRTESLARALDMPLDPKIEKLADKVQKSYLRFWNSENGCLFDVIDHEDASIRPNQIFAAIVPDLLPDVMRRSILEVVARDLLTPFGLRTLSPRDPRYAGRYAGEPKERDSSYHQGTVWPWLIGPYIDLLLAVGGRSAETREKGLEALRPLLDLAEGMGTIPEVFDGDLPQNPGGCISQAWSVGEVLRAYEELRDG